MNALLPVLLIMIVVVGVALIAVMIWFKIKIEPKWRESNEALKKSVADLKKLQGKIETFQKSLGSERLDLRIHQGPN